MCCTCVCCTWIQFELDLIRVAFKFELLRALRLSVAVSEVHARVPLPVYVAVRLRNLKLKIARLVVSLHIQLIHDLPLNLCTPPIPALGIVVHYCLELQPGAHISCCPRGNSVSAVT